MKKTPPETPHMTRQIILSDIINDYLAQAYLRRLSPNTARNYRTILQQLQEHIRRGQPEAVVTLDAVTLEQGRSFITAKLQQETAWENHPILRPQARKLSPYTIKQYVRVIRGFGRWLGKQGYTDPFAKLEMPRTPKRLISILSPEEIDQLVNIYNPNTYYGARWSAIFALLYQSGMRISELLGLRIKDIEFPNFRAKVYGKGSKERYIPFGTYAARALTRYITIFRPKTDDEHVFLNQTGKPMVMATVQSIIQHARKRSGIKRLHFHLIRHTFATNFLLHAKGSDFELQAILGHSSIETTQIYVHLAQELARTGSRPEEAQQKAARLDGMPGLDGGESGRGSRPRGGDGRFRPRLSREPEQTKPANPGPAYSLPG